MLLIHVVPFLSRRNGFRKLVGEEGFEPTVSRPQTERLTRLAYTPELPSIPGLVPFLHDGGFGQGENTLFHSDLLRGYGLLSFPLSSPSSHHA